MKLKQRQKYIILKNILVLSVAILISLFTLNLFKDLNININIENDKIINIFNVINSNFIISYLYQSIFNILNCGLVLILILNIKRLTKYHIIYLVAFTLISNILKIYIPQISVFIDILFFVGIPFVIFGVNIKRILTIVGIYVILQTILMQIKNIAFTSYISNDILTASIFSIDLSLMLIIIYVFNQYRNNLKKEDKPWGQWADSGCLNLQIILKNLQNMKKKLVIWTKHKKSRILFLNPKISCRIKLKFYLAKYSSYILIFLSISITAYFFSMILETVIMVIAFGTMRYLYPVTYHTNIFKCTIISIFSFSFIISIIYNIDVSIIYLIILIAIFCFILFKIQVLIDFEKDLNLKNDIKKMFILYKTKPKYRDYLLATIAGGVKDSEYFDLEKNRYKNIDEQQFRNYKCKFTKILKENDII